MIHCIVSFDSCFYMSSLISHLCCNFLLDYYRFTCKSWRVCRTNPIINMLSSVACVICLMQFPILTSVRACFLALLEILVLTMILSGFSNDVTEVQNLMFQFIYWGWLSRVICLTLVYLLQRTLCVTSLKSLFADEGKHGGEMTVKAVRLIADLVKIHNCHLYPDSIEVWLLMFTWWKNLYEFLFL